MNKLHRFQPDWRHTITPGDSIIERMNDMALTKVDFATNMGYSPKHIHQLIKAKARITEEAALKLEKVLDIPASFWLNAEKNYRQALANEAEKQNLANSADWLKKLPLKSMIKHDWVEKFTDTSRQIQACLKFYGVASIDAWEKAQSKNYQAVFKSSDVFSKNDIAIQTWLRQGEREAQKIDCDVFDKQQLTHSLEDLRALTLLTDPDDFLPKLTAICAKCGVAVVFAPTPDKCPMSGATKWLSTNKALLLLSLRHKTNDHLWFAFFHEIAHILKHKKQLFLEGKDGFVQNQALEDEADSFAADILIPKKYDLSALSSKEKVRDLAKEIGIAPGIVVGRMQHQKKILWSHFNDLKVKYTWN